MVTVRSSTLSLPSTPFAELARLTSVPAAKRLAGHFKDKRVALTGFTSGIGRETAQLLYYAGAKLVLIGRDRLRGATFEDSLDSVDGLHRPEIHYADVRDTDSLAVIFGERAIDVLINNAGVADTRLFAEQHPDAIEELLDVNLRAPLLSAWLVYDRMVEDGGGHLVFVSSLAGLIPIAGYAVYGASKAGLIAFAEGLRQEGLPHHIRVSVMTPPDVDTPQYQRERADRGFPKATKRINTDPPISVQQTALALLEGIADNQFLIFPDRRSRLNGFLARFLPRNLLHWILDFLGYGWDAFRWRRS